MRGLRRHTLAIMGILVLQFLVGMWVNLYTAIPAHHPGMSPDYFAGVVGGVVWSLGAGAFGLRLHVILGLLLGLMGIAHLARVLRDRSQSPWGWSVLGLCGLVGAGANGVSFLNYGRDFSSLLMSVGFALALIGYGMAMTPGRTAPVRATQQRRS